MTNLYFAVVREDGAVLCSVQSSGDPIGFRSLVQRAMATVDWVNAFHLAHEPMGINRRLAFHVDYRVVEIEPWTGAHRVDP